MTNPENVARSSRRIMAAIMSLFRLKWRQLLPLLYLAIPPGSRAILVVECLRDFCWSLVSFCSSFVWGYLSPSGVFPFCESLRDSRMNDRMEIMTIFPSKGALVWPRMYRSCLARVGEMLWAISSLSCTNLSYTQPRRMYGFVVVIIFKKTRGMLILRCCVYFVYWATCDRSSPVKLYWVFHLKGATLYISYTVAIGK